MPNERLVTKDEQDAFYESTEKDASLVLVLLEAQDRKTLLAVVEYLQEVEDWDDWPILCLKKHFGLDEGE